MPLPARVIIRSSPLCASTGVQTVTVTERLRTAPAEAAVPVAAEEADLEAHRRARKAASAGTMFMETLLLPTARQNRAATTTAYATKAKGQTAAIA